MLRELGRLPEAEVAYREALPILRPLARVRGGLPRELLASTLYELGFRIFVPLRRTEEAEVAYREALPLYRQLAAASPATFEPELGGILTDLGGVLLKLRRPDEAERRFREARTIFRRLARVDPASNEPDLAGALLNLGAVLHSLDRHVDAERPLSQALTIFRRLAVADPDANDRHLALTLTNLASVKQRLGSSDEGEQLLRDAVAIRRRLAEVRPEEYEPELAGTLNSLGVMLHDFARPDDAKDAYVEAAQLLGPYDLPDDRRRVLSNLGRLLTEQESWEDATTHLRAAIKEIERLRSEMLTLDRRLAILRENIVAYESLLVCLMKLGRYDEALEVAEQGKSRTLVDLLALRELRPRSAPDGVTRAYEQMLFRARALEDELRHAEEGTTRRFGDPTRDRSIIREELSQATGHLRELAGKIGRLDPDFLPHAAPLDRQEMLDLARDAAATLVVFRVTDAGTFVFLVLEDGTTEVVEVPEFTTDTLERKLITFDEDRPIDGWVVRYYLYRAALEDEGGGRADEARDRWFQGMDETLAELYEMLLRPVHEALRGRGHRELIIVPNRGLAILPLHACWWEERGKRRYLIDEFTIRYAPSLSVFQRCVKRDQAGRRHDTLLAVANPDPPGDLGFAEWECEEIQRLFGDEQCLILRSHEAGESEFKRWVGEPDAIHFACHGQYRLDQPMDSALNLAGNDRLTLGGIFENLYIPQAWLVSLSACETGLTDFHEVADEQFGLPMAFLYAGAPTVYASLWQVNDLSTALLMARAYEGVVKDRKAKAMALKNAQIWVRDLTAEELSEILSQKLGEAEGKGDVLASQALAQELLRFGLQDPTGRPFAHPYWWAAFQSVGA